MLTHDLTLVLLGLGSPLEEGGHVLGHLRGVGLGSVLVLYAAVVDGGGHLDLSAREVGIVVLPLGNGDASGGLAIANDWGGRGE